MSDTVHPLHLENNRSEPICAGGDESTALLHPWYIASLRNGLNIIAYVCTSPNTEPLRHRFFRFYHKLLTVFKALAETSLFIFICVV
jgi:hypothetical protein